MRVAPALVKVDSDTSGVRDLLFHRGEPTQEQVSRSNVAMVTIGRLFLNSNQPILVAEVGIAMATIKSSSVTHDNFLIFIKAHAISKYMYYSEKASLFHDL